LGPATFAASNVTYDNATSGLTATDAQSAIDELSVGVGQYETDSINGFIEAMSDKAYTLIQDAPYNGTIDSLYAQSADGAATGNISIEINGTPVVFTSGTFSLSGTTENNDTTASAKTISAGDKITMTVSSSGDLNNVGFTLHISRT